MGKYTGLVPFGVIVGYICIVSSSQIGCCLGCQKTSSLRVQTALSGRCWETSAVPGNWDDRHGLCSGHPESDGVQKWGTLWSGADDHLVRE